jgi:hypothetical protein
MRESRCHFVTFPCEFTGSFPSSSSCFTLLDSGFFLALLCIILNFDCTRPDSFRATLE